MASPQDEFMKLFSEFKMPAMPDMSAFAEAQKRNIEDTAITAKLHGYMLTNRITERVNPMPGFLGTHLSRQL